VIRHKKSARSRDLSFATPPKVAQGAARF
jgi:hypothetical protein